MLTGLTVWTQLGISKHTFHDFITFHSMSAFMLDTVLSKGIPVLHKYWCLSILQTVCSYSFLSAALLKELGCTTFPFEISQTYSVGHLIFPVFWIIIMLEFSVWKLGVIWAFVVPYINKSPAAPCHHIPSSVLHCQDCVHSAISHRLDPSECNKLILVSSSPPKNLHSVSSFLCAGVQCLAVLCRRHTENGHHGSAVSNDFQLVSNLPLIFHFCKNLQSFECIVILSNLI